MNRVLICSFRILVLCMWIQVAQAAESPAAKNTQPKPGSPQATASQEAGAIQISETVFDFGEIVEGTEVTHQFNVSNSGKGDLQIDQVRPG